MGNQESHDYEAQALPSNEFIYKVGEACKKEKLDEYAILWRNAEMQRKTEFPSYDEEIYGNGIMQFVVHAFRSQKMEWRKSGIVQARSFFHMPKARKKLNSLAFIDSVLLITLPDEDGNDDDDQQLSAADVKKKEEEQDDLQLLAAETIREMADYQDFHDSLCTTSVLNFLCIVLNQVPRSVDVVTDTFVKMSSDESNLVILMEGAMGDILETFFRKVHFRKPGGYDEESDIVRQWYRDTFALSHTAHTLGTLIKYNHQPQVDLPQIIKVFSYALGMDGIDAEAVIIPTIETIGPTIPDNVLLLAELSRLFYWISRRSRDVVQMLYAVSPYKQDEAGLDYVLRTLVAMWKRCIATHKMMQENERNAGGSKDFLTFCSDDLDRTKVLDAHSKEIKMKMEHARMRLCYLNCTLWILLPMSKLRWKLRDCGLAELHLAFELREEGHLQVILGTVRYLVDLPEAQETSDFIRFFGEQLLILVDLALDESGKSLTQKVIRLLLDAISILAMQRNMQTMLANFNIYDKLTRLLGTIEDDMEKRKVELAVLRIFSEVAMHPSHRLSWCCKDEGNFDIHPPRAAFELELKEKMKDSDDNIKTIASLLLSIFQDEKFRRAAADIESIFRSVLDWWQSNTTARFEESKAEEAGETQGAAIHGTVDVRMKKNGLQGLLERAIERKEQSSTLTSMETMPYCAPHECVLALSLFSRLALEPRFKVLYVQHDALEAFLGCVAVGIWAEAREAAACIANLMWLPDLKEEGLVCWLRFDGPRCITVDASNVLLPVRTGNPKPVDIGKGMYKSSWGIEFVEGSFVTLHPDGLKTYQIPGLLTSASPSDTFENMSKKPYEWLGKPPHKKCFTITCWFYWPDDEEVTAENGSKKKMNKVLIQSRTGVPTEGERDTAFDKRMSASYVLYIDYESEPNKKEGKWTLIECVDEKRNEKRKRPLTTPKLKQGWHMLALVSSTNEEEKEFNGTKFFLDEWKTQLDNVWVANDFYRVGNAASNIAPELTPSPQDAKRPFGLITDFRIYARVLRDDEIKSMVRSRDMDNHPDKLARKLADMNAAKILAQRLDVPDSAAECLRALGSLAALSSQRAKIFSECGRQVLRMLESPLPMIQRQAVRLMNNIF
mmetsp:Transcript_29421/g.51577  ORF Transcript_29421/g.51577 Transcript_29421/m.51577 type:complete len:1122 (-) Transcript_29421:32-3397(-)